MSFYVMACILLIETATEVCSTAVSVEGRVVALQEERHSTQHAALLTLQIEAAMQQAGLDYPAVDAVAVSAGPGSYTSLRVGASVAKGLCYALRKPLIAVDTLLALAYASRLQHLAEGTAAPTDWYLPMLDARRQEVWAAIFDADMRMLAEVQPVILENNLFEDFLAQTGLNATGRKLILSGNGAFKVKSVPPRQEAVRAWCSAEDLAYWAERKFQDSDFQDVAYWQPFYMKLPSVTTPRKKI